MLLDTVYSVNSVVDFFYGVLVAFGNCSMRYSTAYIRVVVCEI